MAQQKGYAGMAAAMSRNLAHASADIPDGLRGLEMATRSAASQPLAKPGRR